MKINDYINKRWLDTADLAVLYEHNDPFPHIVMDDFLVTELADRVEREFPELSQYEEGEVIRFSNVNETKLASIGTGLYSASALELHAFLQSDLMLRWLSDLTGLPKPLISDPYLSGGGYHQIASGGFLNIHADFRFHPKLVSLERKLNLLIYLNPYWDSDWGGALNLYRNPKEAAVKSIVPKHNRAVIFTTDSQSFHGHPDPLCAPNGVRRKSLAYYYFSEADDTKSFHVSGKTTHFHSDEAGSIAEQIKAIAKAVIPPFALEIARRVRGRQ